MFYNTNDLGAVMQIAEYFGFFFFLFLQVNLKYLLIQYFSLCFVISLPLSLACQYYPSIIGLIKLTSVFRSIYINHHVRLGRGLPCETFSSRQHSHPKSLLPLSYKSHNAPLLGISYQYLLCKGLLLSMCYVRTPLLLVCQLSGKRNHISVKEIQKHI